MTGQIDDDFRFIYFVALNVLIAFVAQSKGLLIGSMYANRVDSAVFVAPLSIVPFLLFAGFFVHLESLPAYLRALPTISYFKVSFTSHPHPSLHLHLHPHRTFCLEKFPVKK